ncbi:four-carbon acid sugar kinase family protein [Variovorax sp. EBFNA2]|uniref:four-carbon acid sugar kinase family protein n=1 Tax=Variovorax sp. EBFNA2 TaxID=3342097 RepID=UPI0029C0595F|nr:four-carbon acid sugar kinase family protein [Variovorax boronicumulans]WPG38830.1 four-carbon acid sugar kinase family protein [Variovorax boronicumulans]
MMQAPAVVYYGDDFTGATDTLGTAARAGLRALLFLKTPDAARLERVGPLDVLGIAGAARAMTPEAMRVELAPVAALFRSLGARVLHYKTCSTFDSAPHIGSIGAAVRALRSAVEAPWTAIVGGQPNLGRHCLFGNLFAAAGAGGEVFRIDRHPTMSQHPVTPMHEADLRRHLAGQGLADVHSIPFTAASKGSDALEAALQRALQPPSPATSPDAVLFDVADAAQLAVIGQVLWARARHHTLLAVGPSSVVDALAPALDSRNGTELAQRVVTPASGPVLVLAGSLSPVTARQVAAARSFETVWLDASAMAQRNAATLERHARDIANGLANGRNVLACTRPLDPLPLTPSIDAQALARAGGELLARVLAQVPLQRVGIAGGDTSSHAVQALDAWGLSYVADIGAGTSLCRVHSDDAALDGLEIMLKGGQMGSDDVFERLVHSSL